MKMKDFNINMAQYKRGDIITGSIVMIGEREVVVALGGLKEGVFPKSELPAPFKLGDAILVMITGKVDDKGCLVVTHAGVNKALEDKEKLLNIKIGSEISFKVNEISTAGLIGDCSGYRIFLPYSQCRAEDYIKKDSLKDQELLAIVIELDNIKKSIVCSSKLLIKDEKIEPIEIGEIISGKVIKLEDKYAIAHLINGSKAKLSISDASYEHIDSLKSIIEEDKEYQFKVLDINSDLTRISIGLKHLSENPLNSKYDQLNIGDKVEGEVIKIMNIGALIKLDNGLTSLAITKENTDRSNVLTHHIYKLGARIKGQISKIDYENHKINIITK